MIGGLFIYNHKGEVLISRVYRDDIGYIHTSVLHSIDAQNDSARMVFILCIFSR